MGIDSGREDAELWRVVETDPQAFGELYERYARAVFGFCARQTGNVVVAEDLTSVVFLEAWRKRRSIRIDGRGALPWLLGTANNVVRNQRRSLRRHRLSLRRLAVNAVSPGSDGEDEVIARLDAQRTLSAALRAIDGLPQKQREALNLVLWSGLSYEDAARALGVPVGTVRSRVARARAAVGETVAAPLPTITKEPL